LTRPELKRQRELLARFERYLPMLKLKQQQLQLVLHEVEETRHALLAQLAQARRSFEPSSPLLKTPAGLDITGLAEPAEVRTSKANVAGVNIPVFQETIFPPARYSLFATPAWADRVLEELRGISRLQAQRDVVARQHQLLHRELVKVVQRVNLFEKVKIPEATDAIRVIRIKLGDEMTAAVGRAKIAKAKLPEIAQHYGRHAGGEGGQGLP
jgi:V/A-type H+-transporting ATPase subunit D